MKTYVVVGLGRFGQSIACRLCELGNEVLALDKNPEYVQQISNFVTQAVVGRCPGLGCAPGFGHSEL